VARGSGTCVLGQSLPCSGECDLAIAGRLASRYGAFGRWRIVAVSDASVASCSWCSVHRVSSLFCLPTSRARPVVGSRTRTQCVERWLRTTVMDQFRWFTGGWRVNAELPLPASFDVASRTVRQEDAINQMPCGPDVARHLAGIREFQAAGFTHIALVQVGADSQQDFISWAASELLPALRA
jgi:hypothetical protein